MILCLCSLSFFSCFVVEGSTVISPPSFHPLLRTFPLHLLQNNAFPFTSPVNIPIHIKLLQYEFPWFPQTLSHCSALHTHTHALCVDWYSYAQVPPPLLLTAANLLRELSGGGGRWRKGYSSIAKAICWYQFLMDFRTTQTGISMFTGWRIRDVS